VPFVERLGCIAEDKVLAVSLYLRDLRGRAADLPSLRTNFILLLVEHDVTDVW